MSIDQNVSAEINRTILLEVLDAALVGLKFQLDDADAKMETDILRIMSTKKTFWTKRAYTRDEALNHLYADYGLGWLAYGEKVRVAEKIGRVKNLQGIAQSSKLTHIRMSESDLSMLRKYL